MDEVPDWTRNAYFPTVDGEDMQAWFDARWTVEGGQAYPRLGWMRCPMCSSKRVELTGRTATPLINFWCHTCFYVWQHKLPFVEETG